MATDDSSDPTGIASDLPAVDLVDVSLPPHVGARLAAFYDREEPFETAAEWVDVMERHLREEVGEIDPDTVMCTTPDGGHEVAVGEETRSYVCVLDPLAVPFLEGAPATVTSTAPAGDGTVTIRVGDGGVSVSPPGAVLSLGVGHDVADVEPTLEAAYEQLCAYTHAFASPAAYESWAAGVDASTTSLPAGRGVALAGALVEAVDV